MVPSAMAAKTDSRLIVVSILCFRLANRAALHFLYEPLPGGHLPHFALGEHFDCRIQGHVDAREQLQYFRMTHGPLAAKGGIE